MAVTLHQVASDALALTPDERVELVDILLESNQQDDQPLSAEWLAEIKRRIQSVEDGAETFSAEEVLAELERKYP